MTCSMNASRIWKICRSLTNITTSTGTNGAVDVSIGGQTLVSGNQVLDTLQTYDAGSGQLLVQTATGGVNLTLTGGSMQGTIDARDGELATMQSSINTLASTLITQVNAIHSGGYSLTGTTGANFFNGSDAATITVNAALVNNPSLIQASGTSTATGDNSVALQLADLASDHAIRFEQPDFWRFLRPDCGRAGRFAANGQRASDQSNRRDQYAFDAAQFRQRRERGRGDDEPDEFSARV